MKDNDAINPKKTTKHKKAPAETTENALMDAESTDLSSVFFSQYNSTELPIQNKKSTGILENFVILFRNALSTFLGKKIDVQFDHMKVCELKELHLDKTAVILSSVQFTTHQQSGLLFFDYAFMHFIIDILYGAGQYKNDTIITSLGKSGIVIAEKVATLCVNALQEAIKEYEPVQIERVKTTEQRGLILNKPLSEQYVHFAFYVHINEKQCPLHIAIPDALYDEITYQEEQNPIQNNATIVNDSLKKDIIDSTITLVASLQEIKVKITDIMNLKSGDLIPIHDPTIVFMKHNDKKIFKGTVGQANSLRVVKIIDNL